MKTYHYLLIFVLIIILGIWYFRPNETVVNNPVIVAEVDLEKLPQKYENQEYNFQINLPKDFTVIKDYTNFISPDKVFPGIKFKISEELYKGTNLSSDTYISIERTKVAPEACGAELFFIASELTGLEDINGRKYTKAISLGAGAGNRYDETIYATSVGEYCYAIRYLIHYSIIENYPEGAVKEFDIVAIRSIFDLIRKTIIIKD